MQLHVTDDALLTMTVDELKSLLQQSSERAIRDTSRLFSVNGQTSQRQRKQLEESAISQQVMADSQLIHSSTIVQRAMRRAKNRK